MNRTIGVAPFLSLIALLAACSQPRSGDQEGMTSTSPRPATPAPAVMSEEGVVYTANERGNSISAIDVSTGHVRDVATPMTPHNVQVSRDGRLLLAVGPAVDRTANQPPMKMPDGGEMVRGRLLMIDAETLAVQSAVDIEIGRHPAHVSIDPEGKRVYATNSEDANVLVIDVAQRQVIGEIKTRKFPHGLRMSPNGRDIYVANVDDDSVSVIDVMQSKEVARIPVGRAPVQVGFTPDGGRAYVSLRDENHAAVIDTGRRRKVASIAVGHNPIQVFVTPDGRHVYVANQGTEANPDNTVSVIDTATQKVIKTVKVGDGPNGVTLRAANR